MNRYRVQETGISNRSKKVGNRSKQLGNKSGQLVKRNEQVEGTGTNMYAAHKNEMAKDRGTDKCRIHERTVIYNGTTVCRNS
jgi:hypothetical protein